MALPTEAKARKSLPLFSGVLRYFPDALTEVADVSRVGNEQHNPGQPLHWDKSKSQDEYDALSRHLLEVGTRDSDGVRHAAKVAWRALAGLQREIDKEREEQRKREGVQADMERAMQAGAQSMSAESLKSYGGLRGGASFLDPFRGW